MVSWDFLRDTVHTSIIETVIRQASFLKGQVATISLIRTAHYAVFEVVTASGRYVARVGVAMPEPFTPQNSGPYGVALNVTHDQSHEYEMGEYLHVNGAQVIQPIAYERTNEGYDILWLPYVQSLGRSATTEEWAALIETIQQVPQHNVLPVFGNYQKTKTRILARESGGAELLREYEKRMKVLFDVASRWSVVHGDLHAENTLVTDGGVYAYDLDTVSWTPAVWDIAHLGVRQGSGANVGYDIDQLRRLLGFTKEEYQAAVQLRVFASQIARGEL